MADANLTEQSFDLRLSEGGNLYETIACRKHVCCGLASRGAVSSKPYKATLVQPVTVVLACAWAVEAQPTLYGFDYVATSGSERTIRDAVSSNVELWAFAQQIAPLMDVCKVRKPGVGMAS